jgi:hypothetical protein
MDTQAAGLQGACVIVASLIFTPVPRGTAVPPAPEVGCYQVARRDGVNCFVLDTRSGRLWQRFVESSAGSAHRSEDKAPGTKALAT